MSEHITFISLPKNPHFKDLAGQRFGRWLVLGYAGRIGKAQCTAWHCLCDCGAHKIVLAMRLLKGDSQSCGCYALEVRRTNNLRHGGARRSGKSAEYTVWHNMLNRCDNPRSKDYPRYGGRGITVCDRWKSFENFLADMGPRPSPKHTLDRINNNGNYESSNCCWATRKEQGNNRRDNRLIAYNGETHTLTEWVEKLGLAYSALKYRLNAGMTFEEAIASPPQRRVRRL